MAEYPALMLWTDAYLADTTDLSAEEHGAYLLLLMAAWRTPDCSLPDDDERLSRMSRVGIKKWRNLRPIMLKFWTVSDGRWTQKRLLKERARSDMLRSRNAEAGKASALKRKETGSTSVSTKIQPPLPIPIPSKESKNLSGVVKGALRARKGTDFSDERNRQAYARSKIAPAIGWEVMMAAEDPTNAEHKRAVELAQAEARRQSVMWKPPVVPMKRSA